MAQTKRPAHEIRRGPIKTTIWENRGMDGVFFKFTGARLYKDGDDWKSTSWADAGAAHSACFD